MNANEQMCAHYLEGGHKLIMTCTEGQRNPQLPSIIKYLLWIAGEMGYDNEISSTQPVIRWSL